MKIRKKNTYKETWFRSWLMELRPHQWIKNVLVFVPLITGHVLNDIHLVFRTFEAFLAFSLITSATYILNDVADIESDRQHETKKSRPVAAGKIPIRQAVSVALILLASNALACFMLAPSFALAVAGYLSLSLLYTYWLKRVPLLDVAVISGLFTLRIIMGSLLTELPLSPWLNSFSASLFFSLALAKRHVEIIRFRDRESASFAARGYEKNDWPLTLGFGTASAATSIVILLLFIVNEAGVSGIYKNPAWLFVLPVCMALWIQRIWLFSHRGTLADDPIIFAVKDKISYLLGGIILAAFIMAL